MSLLPGGLWWWQISAHRITLILGVTLAWAYWPTFGAIARRWSEDPQYTHGYVVPVFAAIVLWRRRLAFPRGRFVPSPTWGLALFCLAGILRLAGAYFYLESLDAFSLVLSVVGAGLFVAGWPIVRWGWTAALFLLLMVPLPYQVDVFLTQPLLRITVRISAYALQVLGLPAYTEGNVIHIDDLQIGVIEACSGLGMLMTFLALSVAVAFLIHRPFLDRVVVLASAIPVGALMNCVRIILTALLASVLGGAAALTFFHDLAGWLMMPLAMGTLWLELRLLDALFTLPESAGPAPLVFPFPALQANDGQPGSNRQSPLLEVSDATP